MADEYDFATIENFVGGYFHQNWIDFAADEDSVITQMLCSTRRLGSLKYLADLGEELARLLALNLDEHELRDLLRNRYNCNCDPHLDGSTWRLWLEHLRDRVDAHLKFSL